MTEDDVRRIVVEELRAHGLIFGRSMDSYMKCQKCGADRSKEPCNGLPLSCPFSGVAQTTA